MENEKKISKRKIFYIVLSILAVILIISLIFSNTYIDVEKITFKSRDIPESFDGAKIVLLSDYHNQGENFCERLTDIVKEADPDYIFITGDIIDRIRTDVDKADNFLKKVSDIAPCYLVWGNHDKSVSQGDLERLKTSAVSYGITILEGTTVRIQRGDEYISLTGNYYYYDYPPCEADFNIWLNHFPENFEPIAEQTKKDGNQMDLMFSGHAHGGLIRLPFVGGVIGHNGLFPDYTSGLYEYDGSHMIVSRGLGNSGNVPRLYSTFHVVVCELEREE
ncbi:MAG: metallophosphoesterase [Oscillospiraceae bacterium]|nr:metallophosphoesterase [Oscillospiraceae bacterium]